MIRSAVSPGSPSAFSPGTPNNLTPMPSVEPRSGSVGEVSLEKRTQASSALWAKMPTRQASGIESQPLEAGVGDAVQLAEDGALGRALAVADALALGDVDEHLDEAFGRLVLLVEAWRNREIAVFAHEAPLGLVAGLPNARPEQVEARAEPKARREGAPAELASFWTNRRRGQTK